MANLLFQLEPIAHRQVEFIVPDNEWEELQKQLPEGYVADDVYTLVNEKYRGVEIAVEVYGGGVAFDYEVRDCDCGA
jgi:hypothetical protein